MTRDIVKELGATEGVKMTDESGARLKYLGFPDTLVESHSERILKLENLLPHKIMVTVKNIDPTIKIESYTEFLEPLGFGRIVLHYKPTMKLLKEGALDSLIEVTFKVV